ncbi:MAG TPA: YoaP domain-containing protein [Bacteroidales bacterium]|nr:YoaP domain-containing protein [Bacteroidales bacterium]HSA44651.1 YoaP domain-containing protein [Bacteroidales bacterium]
MNDFNIVDLTPENFAEFGVCGYKDIAKHKELRAKLEWFTGYYPKGLRIKVVVSPTGGYQGMIEYIPGEFAHRPVSARGFMFIHCIFVGFRKDFKGKGLASSLISECIDDAKALKLEGVTVVTRKGSFMAGSEIFIKNGFVPVEKAKPDFELMVKKFKDNDQYPSFNQEILTGFTEYQKGLTIFRSPQCPYTEKNVIAILETAQKKYRIKTQLIEIQNHQAAQNTPSPFGSFAMILNGKLISHHPISNTRFENIMNSLTNR